MAPSESSQEVGARAANVLAPESSLFVHPDVAELGGALTSAMLAAASRPYELNLAATRFAFNLARIGPAALARWAGAHVAPPLPVDGKDRRFADPAWNDNAGFFALRQGYVAFSQFAEDLIAAAQLDPATERKARLLMRLIVDASAPTNLLVTNPAALKRAFETGGASVLKG